MLESEVVGGIMIGPDGRATLPPPTHDDPMAHLIRMAGSRPDVPADRAARVNHAVYSEWRRRTRRRNVRRRTVAASIVLLATAAVLVVIVRRKMPENVVAPMRDGVATVERVDVEARVFAHAAVVARFLSTNDSIEPGDWVETDRTARTALRLADGASIRLDTASRARVLSAKVIELARGALYLDVDRSSTGLEVRTPLGTARDIGTQFEIRLSESSLRLRVRAGVVELRRDDRSMPARAGTELTIAANKTVSRVIPLYGPDWEWVVGLAPAFDIEGRPLGAFLDYLSREHGWTLGYADAALARDTSSIILHGSVDGLQPREALAVALTTSGLSHRVRDGELFLFRSPDAK